MKGYAKIRLAVFLCIVMVLPSVISVLPMTALEVSAASSASISWNYNFNSYASTVIQIEKGEKFNIGDFAYVYDGANYGCASQFKKVSYSSSKKSIATVDSKGNLHAKRTGKVTITIKYKGQKIRQNFQIVKTGSLSSSKACNSLRQKTKQLAKLPSKITSSNGYKYLNMVKSFDEFFLTNSMEISHAGFLKETVQSGIYTYYNPSNKLAVPQIGRLFALQQLLYQFADKNSPTSTSSSKILKISSVSASTSGITIKTKQKVTATHLLASYISYSSLNEKPNKKSADVYISVYDQTEQKYYSAIATLKKGSKTIFVKIGQNTYNPTTGNTEFRVQKLKKGHTYMIGNPVSWGSGKKVKIK